MILLLALAVLGDPRTELVEARHRFEQGDYKGASELLRPLVDHDVLSDAAERNEALRLYGVASFLEGRRGDAEGAFTALLVHDPNVQLDPALYPPDVVQFFGAIRARREAELARTERRAGKHLVLALIPFGVGQFQNGQRKKAWALLSVEVALAGAATTTYLLLKSDEQTGHTFSDTGEARTLRQINLATGITFAAVAVYGVLDAVYYYRKDRDDDQGGMNPPSHASKAGAGPAPLWPRAAIIPTSGGLLLAAGWGF